MNVEEVQRRLWEQSQDHKRLRESDSMKERPSWCYNRRSNVYPPKAQTGGPTMLYLAIDQHRKQLTVNLRNESGDVLLKRQVSTEWPRVRKFLEEVQKQSQAEGGFVAILI